MIFSELQTGLSKVVGLVWMERVQWDLWSRNQKQNQKLREWCYWCKWLRWWSCT